MAFLYVLFDFARDVWYKCAGFVHASAHRAIFLAARWGPFLSLFWGTQGTQGFRSHFAHLWAPEKAGVMLPLLILSSLLGTPENTGVI